MASCKTASTKWDRLASKNLRHHSLKTVVGRCTALAAMVGGAAMSGLDSRHAQWLADPSLTARQHNSRMRPFMTNATSNRLKIEDSYPSNLSSKRFGLAPTPHWHSSFENVTPKLTSQRRAAKGAKKATTRAHLCCCGKADHHR